LCIAGLLCIKTELVLLEGGRAPLPRPKSFFGRRSTVLEDGVINSQALRLVDAALKGRVPAVFGLSSLVAAGGFMSYAPSRPELWRRAALLTDKILRGAKPADLPVAQPTKFELVLNLKTAKALGVTIPPSSMVRRADEVIQ
jgi:putative tryptophan/tyrosine transport system substrate-binding protein